MRFPPVALCFALILPIAVAAQQAPALTIVVVEGEGGVNIIQQKTAVRPLVEVRDRNNLPVAGATVTFTIGGGGQTAAFAGGVPTLTVTTNAAGQAAAGGLNAISSGAFQIQVSAAYQGQVATAAISQTNFATAAAAAQAGAGAGGSGGSASGAGAAGGGGGGMSGTTIAIVGAAVGGGAIAATQLAGGGQGENKATKKYSGAINGQATFTLIVDSSNGTSTQCVSARTITGTLTIEMEPSNTTGFASSTGTMTETSISGGSTCTPQPGPLPFNPGGPVSGGPGALTFSQSSTGTTPTNSGTVTVTEKVEFKGSLSGDTITGTLGWIRTDSGTNGVGGITGVIRGSGSSTIPVTLR